MRAALARRSRRGTPESMREVTAGAWPGAARRQISVRSRVVAFFRIALLIMSLPMSSLGGRTTSPAVAGSAGAGAELWGFRPRTWPGNCGNP